MKIDTLELIKHKTLFIDNKKDILANWISYDLPKEILLQHSIEPKIFIDTYGSGVFDYFMGVISGETEIGNCPVMQELLNYLKDREISADELFEICSHFRRSMVDFSYDTNINSKVIFDEISYIFDQNFHGILRYYTDTIFQKLIDARAKAEKATLAKDHFLSNMSHEIRTPLNAILGFVNLLSEEDLSKKHRNYLDIIHTSGETLLSIMNDILDFSKLRSGEFTIEPKVFSIHEELSHTLELFVASASSKNITILSFIDPLIPKEINADPLRIKQIISNFLSNAIKFTPNKGRISVDASCDNSILKISVADNGVGIDKKDQENIFSAFTQAYDKTLDSISGTGLGLSISRQLAELMDGRIYVDSELGHGCKFYLEVPIKIEKLTCDVMDGMGEFIHKKVVFYLNNEQSRYKLDSLLKYFDTYKINIDIVDSFDVDFDVALFINEDINDKQLKNYILNDKDKKYISIMSKENDEYENADHIATMTFPVYCSKLKDKFLELLHPNIKDKISQSRVKRYIGNILVAEDNEANQELIRILLKKYGLQFDMANNGLEAYDLYRQNNNYDLILMDEQMPIMDGNKSVAKILNYEKNMGLKHTPVSALTANVIKGAKERGLKSGFDSFLGKPIVLKELEKVFNLYLKVDENISEENISDNSDAKIVSGLDINKLMDELQLSKDELYMLLELYLKKMSTIMPDLTIAIDAKDYKQISLLAHSIKGSSANFRIDYLQTLAYEMEKSAKSKDEKYDYKGVFNSIYEYLEGIEIL